MSSPQQQQPERQTYKFLIHTFYATGHVLPMQAVAKALIDRGHRVTWLTSPDQESRVRASGAQFVPTKAVVAVDDALKAAHPTTMDEIVDVFLGGRMTAQVADLRRALALAQSDDDDDPSPVDCLLNDALPQGAAALYELGEVPLWATLGVVPMYRPEERSSTTSALGAILTTPELVLPCFNRQRAKLGLRELGPSDPLHYSPFLHLQASCAALEFGRSMPQTHFVGPLVTPTQGQSEAEPEWWADVVAHPCVVGITQGTFAVDPSTLLIPAIEALSHEEDLLLVVPSPHADAIRTDLAARGVKLDNVRLAAWVPYHLLLPRCRILVTNGGYGSVTQALSHGVPLVCAGTSEDKKDTAARMAAVGAGVDLGTDRPSAERIRGAVREMLTEGRYRESAVRVGRELNALGGAGRACELLERAVQDYRGRG